MNPVDSNEHLSNIPAIKKDAINGSGQPIALRAISNVIKINKLEIKNCSQPDINPYWSDNTDSLKAMYPQELTPTIVNATPEISCHFDFAVKIKIQGSASAICIGLAMRLGTKPEKINHM